MVTWTLALVAAGAGGGAGVDAGGVGSEGAVGELSLALHEMLSIVATQATAGNNNLIRFIDLIAFIVKSLLKGHPFRK